MDYTNKALGLRVQTQIPLNVKKYSANEATLKNLGLNNNLAFTYEKGLIVYCILEGTRYEWKEIEIGDVGLLDNNFTYPDNIIAFGIDYSNKIYNFVKLEKATLPIVQNNFVRQIIIDVMDLPESYTVSDIIDYILALDIEDRTIEDITSKVNVIIASIGEGVDIFEIYEIQNIGKGVITSLNYENLLLLKNKGQGLQDVLNVDSNLPFTNNIQIDQTLQLTSGIGGSINGILIFDEIYTNSSIPFVQIGTKMGNSSTDVSLNFLPTKTIFNDGLNNKGLEYPIDYSINFTNNSLITKKYADNRGNLVSGETTSVLFDGSSLTPYKIEIKNLQKFITNNYTLTASDNNYSIKINNGSTPITITVPTGLPENFFAGFTQKGTADVTFVGSGTTISNPTGFKIKGQGYCVGLEQIGTSNNYDLMADTKI